MFQAICNWFKELICGAPVQEKPEPTKTVEPAPPSGPYRTPEETKPVVQICEPFELSHTVSGDDTKDKETIDRLVAKSMRRAKRYFEGKKVKHRVTVRERDAVEFSFFRRSGKPVRIKVTRAPAAAN